MAKPLVAGVVISLNTPSAGVASLRSNEGPGPTGRGEDTPHWGPPSSTAPRPKSPHDSLTLYQVLDALHDLLQCWKGTCTTCGHPSPQAETERGPNEALLVALRLTGCATFRRPAQARLRRHPTIRPPSTLGIS